MGFSSTLLAGMQQVLAEAFENKLPGNRLDAVGVNAMDMYLWDDRVALGLDAIVGWMPPGAGTDPSPVLTAGPPIRTNPPALVMSDQHPFAHRASVDVEELADVEMLMAHGTDRLTVPWVPAPPERPPFECRAVWPTVRQTPAIGDFARIAARTGQAAGWLDPAGAD